MEYDGIRIIITTMEFRGKTEQNRPSYQTRQASILQRVDGPQSISAARQPVIRSMTRF